MKHEIQGPVSSIRSLKESLSRLGVQAGMNLIVHSSFKSLGHVIGGPVAVILALEECLTSTGTLVMPAFTESLCDPSTNENQYPQEYWEEVRATLPVYLPDLTPVDRSIGILPDVFRKQAGTLRSSHPHLSFVARGMNAAFIINDQSFDYALGENSPLSRLYELNGHILLLGAPFNSNTSLHLAEYRVLERLKKPIQWSVCSLVNNERAWIHYDDIENNSEIFPDILNDYIRGGGLYWNGKVGQAGSYLMPQRSLVDFGIQWLNEH
jgi:aminoglycoside 3-N-acetyltransferase